jgi:flagellar motor protein MotB
MEDHGSSEHLSSSLTDLMTSLMVIFILLLLVFISHTASKDAALRDTSQELKTDLDTARESLKQGFKEIQSSMKEPDAILVIVPNKLMGFETEKSTLKKDGRDWLKAHIPAFAEGALRPDFKSSIDSIVVEGHTDTQPWRGMSREELE